MGSQTSMGNTLPKATPYSYSSRSVFHTWKLVSTMHSSQDSTRAVSDKDSNAFDVMWWWAAEDLFSLFNERVSFQADTDEKNYLQICGYVQDKIDTPTQHRGRRGGCLFDNVYMLFGSRPTLQ